jgi:hypothetical protein
MSQQNFQQHVWIRRAACAAVVVLGFVPAAVTHADSVTPVSGSQGAAQTALAAAATIATNEPGVMTYPAPPASFAAATASDADLARYGFPPRPDPGQAPEAYRTWVQVVSAAKYRVAATLTPQPDHKSVEYGPTWSGTALAGGTGQFTAAEGEWVVPNVGAATQPSYSCTWVGIDGFHNQSLAQLGTEQDALLSGRRYYAWVELIPNPQLVINVPVAPGQVVFVEVAENPGTRAVYFFLENVTTGAHLSLSGIYGAQLGQNTEWITERTQIGGSLPALAPFGTVTMGNDYVQSGGLWYGANASPFSPHVLYMYGASGRLDAFARPVNATTDQMVWTGYN